MKWHHESIHIITSGAFDPSVKIWNVSSGACEKTLTGHELQITCLIELSDRNLATASDDELIKIWNPKTGTCLQTLAGHSVSFVI